MASKRADGSAAPSKAQDASDSANDDRWTHPREAPDSEILSSRQIAELVFPELAAWKGVLARLNISFADAVGFAARADANRWPLGQEIIAAGLATEAEFARAFAAEVGLRFQDSVETGNLLLAEDEAAALLKAGALGTAVRQEGARGQSAILLSPLGWNPIELAAYLQRRPGLRGRLRIVPREIMRRALWGRAGPWLQRNAALGLSDAFPHMSARFLLVGWQGALVGAGLALLPTAALLAPHATLIAVHIAASILFLCCVVLRACAACAPPPAPPAAIADHDGGDLPVYSVLVALHREAAVVPDLLRALEAIDWPAGKLEVRLVCEADDPETIEAVRTCRPPPFIEVVEVPPGLPRTKPKALNFALPTTKGEFVVLYDAEDRPDPLQLREAFQRFRAGGRQLACLQAPLVVSNRSASLVARMFAAEYAALFRALLPFLARRSGFVPLGGTSNHFRRDALDAVGAWDPFNVTEDADLGLRLMRLGFRTEMLSRPTLEDGPEDWATWLPQRSRWFKGWALTWCVHMRAPFQLARDLRPLPFLLVQVLLMGMVASSLVHPLFIVTVATLTTSLAAGHSLGPIETGLVVVDIANIVLGYASFLLLVRQGSTKAERRGFGRVALALPLYWLMLSLAAWKAMWQLWRQPHHWHKTPHKPARSVPDSEGLSAAD